MCLIVFAYYPEGTDYKLVLTANRDERYHRPTRPARFWSLGGGDSNSNVFMASQDERAGGTWLGVDRDHGRFAAVTNYWDQEVPPPFPAAAVPESTAQENPSSNKASPPLLGTTSASSSHSSSRGRLVVDFLSSPPETSAQDFLEQLHKDPSIQQTMKGFNLLLMDASGMLFQYNNRVENEDHASDFSSSSFHQQKGPLSRGTIYAMSNVRFNNDDSPKIRQAKAALKELLLQRQHATKTSIHETNSEHQDTKLVQELRDMFRQHVGTDRTRHDFLHDPQHQFGTVNNTVVLIQAPENKENDQRQETCQKITFSEEMYDETATAIHSVNLSWTTSSTASTNASTASPNAS
jgi:uncharacterized protein with NRDE domain